MIPRFPILSLLLLAASGRALPAQEPDSASLYGRIARVRDTTELHRLEVQHARAHTVQDQLTAGFAALQLWRVTGETEHAKRSRRHFDDAADQDPASAWAHYGHALSLEPDIGRGPGRLAVDDAFSRALGIDARSRARRDLERAVGIDPALPGAAELLGEYAAVTRDGSAAQLARRALDQVAAGPDASTEVLLSLARTAREQGDYEAAATAANRAVAHADTQYAQAELEAARGLASVAHRRPEAAAAYQEALAHADDALLSRLWDDVAYIRQERDQAAWAQAGTPDAKREALRAFWELRGALAGRSAMERAGEHYARLNFAWQHLRRWGEYGAAPRNAYRLEKIDPVYSDRGVIYIRHGQPDFLWQSAPGDHLVWYYHDQDGGPLSYHFIRYEGLPGWSKDHILVRRLPCLDPEVALHDKRLRPLTYGCNGMRIESVSLAVRADVTRALRTDSDAPRFRRELPFHYDLYTFRGPAGTTELVAGIGVPLEKLPAGLSVVQLAFALVDTARYSAVRAGDGLEVPDGAARANGGLLRSQLLLAGAPAAAAAYRIAVQDSAGDVGTAYGGTIELPDYRGSALQLSDVVLAAPDSAGSFRRGQHSMALAPTQVFAAGRFRVFYELYNLPAGESYRTEIRIEPVRHGLSKLLRKRNGVALRFDDLAPEAGVDPVYQLRDVTAPLAPGDYLMRVRVRSGGQESERTRRFTVPE